MDNYINKVNYLISIWDEFIKDKPEKDRIEWETEILTTIQPHKNEDMGDVLDSLISTLIKCDTTWFPSPGNPYPLNIYKAKKFNSFADYFERELSDVVKLEIQEKCKKLSIASMSESDVESFGNISDMSKIISLKKPSENVVNTLKQLWPNINENYNFINTKLLITYYHRIHSPISGKIQKIISIPKEQEIFGENSLNIVCYDNAALLLVGESKIQDFKFKVKEGESVKLFQELGNFDWGSQTVLLYDSAFFKGQINLTEEQHLFVGNPLINQ